MTEYLAEKKQYFLQLNIILLTNQIYEKLLRESVCKFVKHTLN